MAEEALAFADLTVRDLDGVVVSGGPGSYTGLRIGASTAKGLAFAHGIPLLSVPSLDAIAYASTLYVPPEAQVLVTRNSRKDEHYLALYKHSGERSVEQVMGPTALLHAELGQAVSSLLMPGELWIAGEGSEISASLLAEHHPYPIHCIPEYSVSPSAMHVAYLGALKYTAEQFEDVSSYEPMYLKDFIPKKRTTSIFDRLPF